VLLRDDDIVVVQSSDGASADKSRKKSVQDPEKISFEVKIRESLSDSSLDTVSNENQGTDQEVQRLENISNPTSAADSSPKSSSASKCIQAQSENVTDEKESKSGVNLEDGEVLMTDQVADEEEETDNQLFVPFPDFSEDELDDSFKISKDNLTVSISYLL
jgi:hypothetical protein